MSQREWSTVRGSGTTGMDRLRVPEGQRSLEEGGMPLNGSQQCEDQQGDVGSSILLRDLLGLEVGQSSPS